MSKLQITSEEYLTEIMMSEDLFLFVEGSDDEEFFISIYNNLKNIDSSISSEKLKLLKKLTIATAGEIEAALGNRDKVEELCRLVLALNDNSVSQRVLGFVDREFREFEYGQFLQDKLNTHKINGRLIWSRGHSIENYLFEIATWRETFNGYPVSRFYQEAFEIFESKFDDILRISCSLSLAGLSDNVKFKLISDTLDWKCIEITSKSISINLEEWKKILKKKKLDQIRIDNLVRKFEEYLQMTYRHNVEIARWLSHGHIGLNLIFAVYGKCLYTAALSDGFKNPNEEAEKTNRNKELRFSQSTRSWIRNKSSEAQANNPNDFPIKCFDMLLENVP